MAASIFPQCPLQRDPRFTTTDAKRLSHMILRPLAPEVRTARVLPAVAGWPNLKSLPDQPRGNLAPGRNILCLATGPSPVYICRLQADPRRTTR